MNLLEKRNETIRSLDQSLTEAGGLEVFSQVSAVQLLSSFEQFKGEIRRLTPRSAFPEGGAINETSLKNAVNKDALASWLGTAVDFLERAATQIQAAVQLEFRVCKGDEENQTLLKEKVQDQKTIIDLQNQIIEKGQDTVQNFKETVQKEVQSYAGVVASTCANALAPRKLQTVVKKIQDTEDRSRNLMIYGLTEGDGEDLQKKVADIFLHLGEKPKFSIPCRVGTPATGNVRPVKVSFTSPSVVLTLLSKSRNLRESHNFKTVYISPDRSKEERIARRTLVLELKEKRKGEPDSIFMIKSGKVQRV